MTTASHSPRRVPIPIRFPHAGRDPFAAFVEKYLEDGTPKASVVASPGMGKTTVALRIAGEMVRRHRTDLALVLCDAKAVREQLIGVGSDQGLRLMRSTAKIVIDEPAGFCLATSRLGSSPVSSELLELGKRSSFFILVDDAHLTRPGTPAFASKLLSLHPRSRLLALITPFQTVLPQQVDTEAEWRALTEVEYLFEPDRPAGPELVLQSVVIAHAKLDEGRLIQAVAEPWFDLIREMLREPGLIYQISPRKWEEIVAGAYVRAGFDEVVLVGGPGDRGRDIIATKYGLGQVRVIDQVKAFKPGHLVTANDVRALMGVLHTDGASKGFVTTTSGFAPRLLSDPLVTPLMPSRLELVDGTQLMGRLRALASDKLTCPPGRGR